jgi:type IV pilus assembly protein PilB
MTMRKRIGQLLVEVGALDSFQLESALAHQRRWGGRIGRAIVYLGFLREEEVLSAVGNQLGVLYMPLWDKAVPRDVLALVPEKLIRARKVLPVARLREHRRGPLLVACADPSDLAVIDELSFATGLEIRPVLASEDELEVAIEQHLSQGGGRAGGLPEAIDLPEDTSPLRGVHSAAVTHEGRRPGRSLIH